MQNLGTKLIKKFDRVPEKVVDDVEGANLILNIGSLAVVTVGDTLRILRVTRTVEDLATGKVLREITKKLGGRTD